MEVVTRRLFSKFMWRLELQSVLPCLLVACVGLQSLNNHIHQFIAFGPSVVNMATVLCTNLLHMIGLIKAAPVAQQSCRCALKAARQSCGQYPTSTVAPVTSEALQQCNGHMLSLTMPLCHSQLSTCWHSSSPGQMPG